MGICNKYKENEGRKILPTNPIDYAFSLWFSSIKKNPMQCELSYKRISKTYKSSRNTKSVKCFQVINYPYYLIFCRSLALSSSKFPLKLRRKYTSIEFEDRSYFHTLKNELTTDKWMNYKITFKTLASISREEFHTSASSCQV